MNRLSRRKRPHAWVLRSSLLSMVLVLSPAVAPSVLSAQSRSDVDTGHAAFLRGDHLYAEGQYLAAIEAFQESYSLSGQPALLFNLANAYERLGETAQALDALQRYAPHAPPEQGPVLQLRIQSLEARLRMEQAEVAELETEENRNTVVDLVEPNVPTHEAEPQPDLDPSGESIPGLDQPTILPVASASTTTTAGIAILIIGAVSVVGSGGTGLVTLTARDDLEHLCAFGVCPESAGPLLTREEWGAAATDALLFGGIALIALGGLLWAVGAPRVTISTDGRSGRADFAIDF